MAALSQSGMRDREGMASATAPLRHPHGDKD